MIDGWIVEQMSPRACVCVSVCVCVCVCARACVAVNLQSTSGEVEGVLHSLTRVPSSDVSIWNAGENYMWLVVFSPPL